MLIIYTERTNDADRRGSSLNDSLCSTEGQICTWYSLQLLE